MLGFAEFENAECEISYETMQESKVREAYLVRFRSSR